MRRRLTRRHRILVVAAMLVVPAAMTSTSACGTTKGDHAEVAASASDGVTPSCSSTPSVRATPTPTPTSSMISGPRSMPVPIVTFHHVHTPPDPGSIDKYFYDDPAVFSRQIRYFADHGYTAVTLRQVFAFWRGKGRLPSKPIVITFDDGYRSVYTNAAPVLAEYHWPAVLNLISGWLGPHSSELTTGMVRTLVKRGWEVDSHTVSHPDLTKLGAAELRHELVASRRRLRNLFHVPVDFLCYPGGAYNARTVAAVRKAGYVGALTCDYSLARRSRPYTLCRIALNRRRVGKALAAVLRFAQKRYLRGL
jgi:peptidoglycan/xylan/chitin deacetylase (PgdA/CDA1 family)